MRNMSFALTEPQLLDGTKTVTRRLGWKFLKRGDQVCAVRKGMGLKPGEKIHRLGVCTIVKVSREPLASIGWADCRREGFPGLAPQGFVAMFRSHMKCEMSDLVTRIEFTFEKKETDDGKGV